MLFGTTVRSLRAFRLYGGILTQTEIFALGDKLTYQIFAECFLCSEGFFLFSQTKINGVLKEY